MLANLSYRLKTPLAMSLVIVAAAAVVAAALVWQGYRQASASFVQHTLVLGKTLARTLRPALLHDDVWQAYEILLTPLERSGDAGRTLILLDVRGHIFAASEPRQFAVLDGFAQAVGDRAIAAAALKQDRGQAVLESGDGRYLYLLTPVQAEDGTVLGRLVQRYDQALLAPRFFDVAEGTLYAALATLILLLPLGWLAGKRLAEPLSHLAECLGRVGRELPDAIHCEFPHGRDEIGQLAERFQGMVEALRSKQALEKHLAQSDRLAAVGRLSAGIAHEINNPLGGMLNAISNYRRRGGSDPQAEKTLGLIERGLIQIRETVSALLVEAKLESHALTPDDLEDVRTLIAADAQAKRLRLDWRNEVAEALPLPSAQVRQILLNLLLNAVQASPDGETVSCNLVVAEGRLSLGVGNAGVAIPERRRQHLFEPYFGEGEVHGLGLWVTYQLANQLRGEIVVDSVPGHTRFRVSLPLDGHESD
ncbi:MAG: ATP-binding protein [Pseudomonadota bacterium]|nr:ATP-binding protein [Pseudomonadota bacterium]